MALGTPRFRFLWLDLDVRDGTIWDGPFEPPWAMGVTLGDLGPWALGTFLGPLGVWTLGPFFKGDTFSVGGLLTSVLRLLPSAAAA